MAESSQALRIPTSQKATTQSRTATWSKKRRNELLEKGFTYAHPRYQFYLDNAGERIPRLNLSGRKRAREEGEELEGVDGAEEVSEDDLGDIPGK